MTVILEKAVKKSRIRLVPFMMTLYILAFLDRSGISFAKEAYQLDTGLSNEAYALGAGLFFIVYAVLGVPANVFLRKFGPRNWIGMTAILWGIFSMSMSLADTEAKFLTIRVLVGAAEAGFFPGMIYLATQWFPEKNRGAIMGLFYMGAPLALVLGAPFAGTLLQLKGLLGQPGWFWMFLIQGSLAFSSGIFTLCWLPNSPQEANFLDKKEKEELQNILSLETKNKSAGNLLAAMRHSRIWHLALIYMSIQIGVYGLIFFLPSQVSALLSTSMGIKTAMVSAIPWIAALLGTWFIPRYSDACGKRVSVAAFTLLSAAVGIGISGLVSPFLAVIALCFAAIGFIAVQPVFWTMPAQILSGAGLASAIGFINLFGALGGFFAPIIRVYADKLFSNQSAGLLALAIISLLGVIMIVGLPRINRVLD
ncbi:Sugar phosphate permease [Izhakiella capsodis]|uniref:Sugar phosphate permease n=1 Tax=Izhakiella capsodis TaxID=1367852 RepID=A0A1I4UE64_9GAMM|nr:MFS transporter [Izhakiella capsodis]SFM87248.1 Sugar phosphate permease [Izhakiella capsodis]